MVPQTNGNTPYDLGFNIGDHRVPKIKSVIETKSKKGSAWISKLITIPKVVNIETSAHAKKA
jgi:hypothetical protein